MSSLQSLIRARGWLDADISKLYLGLRQSILGLKGAHSVDGMRLRAVRPWNPEDGSKDVANTIRVINATDRTLDAGVEVECRLKIDHAYGLAYEIQPYGTYRHVVDNEQSDLEIRVRDLGYDNKALSRIRVPNWPTPVLQGTERQHAFQRSRVSRSG